MTKKLVTCIVAILICWSAIAPASSPPPKKFKPHSRVHSYEEWAYDLSIMYVGMWGVYLVTQYDIVMDKSFSSMEDNMTRKIAVLWDEDEWYWNFVGHPLAGSEYYLYFRSRGYSELNSFIGSALSSTIHEEFVETWSEPFSFNDFVVTPTLGSLLGYFREQASMNLVHSNNKFHRFVGRALWLETNFWFFENVEVVPVVDPEFEKTGFTVFAKF